MSRQDKLIKKKNLYGKVNGNQKNDVDAWAGSVMTVEAASSGVRIDAKHFPDKTFRKYVKGFDKNKNGTLSRAERSKAEIIVLSSMGIKNRKGVEYFTNLTELDCAYNQLEKLDVSKCRNLELLNCSGNQLSRLDVSNCSNLDDLDCDENVQVIGYDYED